MNKLLYENKGMRDSNTGGLVAVGIIIGSILLIVSFITKGEMVGPWYLYAAALAGLIAWIVYLSKKERILLKVYATPQGELQFVISGLTHNYSMLIDSYTHWYRKQFVRRVGWETVHYLLVSDKNGNQLRFYHRDMKATIPAGWQTNNMDYQLSDLRFMVGDLPELVGKMEQYDR